MQTHYSKMVLNFKKKTGIYSNSTGSLTFDPTTCSAYSYRWWKFVGIVDGKVVFNNYNYSNSTSKHQNKVRTLLQQLNIKIDIELPLLKGINSSSLQDLITESEELLCEQFLTKMLKRQENYQRSKQRKFRKALENYLDTVVNFRDYEIKDKSHFGTYNKIAVHQVVEDIEKDVENALYNFHRDGFGNIVFYVGV